MLLVIIAIVILVICCIFCILGIKKHNDDDDDEDLKNRRNIKQIPYSIRPETQDIPVTPVRNINRVDVGENNRDHERYSAIDKKIYRRYEKCINFSMIQIASN